MVLAMLEVASERCEHHFSPNVTQSILELGRGLLNHRVELLPPVKRVLAMIARKDRLIIATEGDPDHQTQKTTLSGLNELFEVHHILIEKTAQAYRDICIKHNLLKDRVLEIGNSVHTNILPALNIEGTSALTHFTFLILPAGSTRISKIM